MMILAAATAFVLAGPAPGLDKAAYRDTCGARAASRLVGRPLAEARATLAGRRGVRFICPNCAVTFDLRPRRLNVEFDGQNRVTTVRCG